MKKLVVTFMTLLVVVCLIAGCGGREEPAPFSMQVIPEQIEDAVAGQRCVFLANVTDEGPGSGEGEVVNISATATGAVVIVSPQAIAPGQVAEVTVVPNEASVNETLTVTVSGERDGLEQIETVTVRVGEALLDPEGLALTAAEMRDLFIPWLAANHPEFGITSETEWTGTIVRPHIVVVMYYLFFSEEWEMGVSWHVTIPPHNWARIYLRHRTTEVSPSYAFEISSWSEPDDPYAIDPPELVWR